MGVLHPLHHHVVRMAALAALVTALVLVALLAVPWGSLGDGDHSQPVASPSVPSAPVVTTGPAWATDPMRPVGF
jgi:Zn-dependent protease with chaperone function